MKKGRSRNDSKDLEMCPFLLKNMYFTISDGVSEAYDLHFLWTRLSAAVTVVYLMACTNITFSNVLTHCTYKKTA